MTQMAWYSKFLLVTLINCGLGGSSSHASSGICPSFCTRNLEHCTSNGGSIVGACPNGQPCCNLAEKVTAASCGETRGNDSSILIFRSPNYPAAGHNDLICSFTFSLQNDVVGIVLDFQDFKMDSISYGPSSHSCDLDMFFIKGFKGWGPPPFCGILDQYKMVIDDSKLGQMKNITLHAVLSSPNHGWNIKITQILEKDWPDDNNSSEKSPPPPETSPEEGKTEKLYIRDAYNDVSKVNTQDFSEFHGNKTLAASSAPHLEDYLMNPLVVNGEDTPVGKVPWQASLRYNTVKIRSVARDSFTQHYKSQSCDIYEGLHFCGGTIISEQEILTAAHCFQAMSKFASSPPLNYIMVVVGDSNKCRDDEKINKTSKGKKKKGSMFDHKFSNPTAKAYEVDSVVLHYAYDPVVLMNDIAVVRLKENIIFNDNVHAIPMAKSGEYFNGKMAFVSGWGRTNLVDPNNHGSNILQSTNNVKVDSKKNCKAVTMHVLKGYEHAILQDEKYKDIFKSTLCTISANKSRDVQVGEGDSGGPLVHFREGELSKPVLIGVVSYGNPVVRNSAIVRGKFKDYYQSVAYYRNWIDTTLLALKIM